MYYDESQPIFRPTARVLRDSENYKGIRLVTFELTYHRFIHSELLTHRVFSRNSASSRAIPTHKLITIAKTANVEPLEWGSNRKGMQPGEQLTGEELSSARHIWYKAKVKAIDCAEQMNRTGVHKQIVNRILEPYLPITTIVSSTELDNWFELRLAESAQAEIRVLAEVMKSAYDRSQTTVTGTHMWHTPFICADDLQNEYINRQLLVLHNNYRSLLEPVSMQLGMDYNADRTFRMLLLLASAGKCARVSYLNHSGEHSVIDDVNLCLRLIKNKHLSPLEHIATPWIGETKGNFTGWSQLRHSKIVRLISATHVDILDELGID